MTQIKKVLIMAGGTGGHVFPGIALAEALKAKGVDVFWLGTEGGMEATWVNNAQIPLYKITIKGLRGNGLKGWLQAPVNVTKAWSQAKKIMQDIQPDLVLGMGGFVCGPGGLAAKSLGIPLVLHEQNAIPGLTNKLLAPLARLVITAFPQKKITGKQVVNIGNPVRAGLEEIEVVENTQPCHLLVLGGSRGALALNEILPKALALMDETIRPVVKHQTGEKTLELAQKSYDDAGIQADVVPFIDNMLLAYASADMLLCRSGALTVSELMASARPAIMVPYPHAVDDHQTANAQALVDMHGGEIIQQKNLTPEGLAQSLTVWCEQPEKRVAASLSIRERAKTEATQQIVEKLLAIMATPH
ncbi:undecaprenyldiphospho-muramoylpentapeptide beta-N-acetylglucosaminyltransferase [Thiomicrorhabdus sp. Kp2]|uniref:undecaprenyldiphospho-muramoylpentapeptide beta-N-acetylglucosaminyltransferase n=1 Tax=Thiomicrorhabdus sp. Kp2 TaxID=1123518 RepID=UPI00059539CA|nr:undecaprenyldiphospho-muramoylpentapeptide beta-N-acetylglucosaminyltransferase [Thiomicrorhabdus sp. Kp2]